MNAKFDETAGKFDAGADGYDPHLDDANRAKFNVERASESNLTSGELEGNFAEIFVQAGADIVIDGVPGYEYKEICKKRTSVLTCLRKTQKRFNFTFKQIAT